ncbi:ABC transporter permease [Microbacterium koreense]|uniref:ABC transporter permease n=1 Tax=Microbacterium koreense TaxID=323761 RepID=A0ABW2ZQN1_9MICO
MGAYLARRALQAIPLLIGISIITFVMLQMTPGGPLAAGEGAASQSSQSKIEAMRSRYGLDDPLPLQYVRWLGGIFTGDWGSSFSTGQPVLTAIGERVPATLLLTSIALVVSVVLSLVIGVVAATRHRKTFDYVASGFSFVGLATPSFWLAIMLLYVFSFQLDLLPSNGLRDPRARYEGWDAVWDTALHLILPVLVLTVISVASMSRYVRSSMLDVLGQDYIRTARGSGLSERAVVLRHGLKNAAIPMVTIIVLSVPELFLGAAIVESIFGLPGMGRLFIDAADGRDYPVLLGILMIASLLVVIANLLADYLYARLDPRIRYE